MKTMYKNNVSGLVSITLSVISFILAMITPFTNLIFGDYAFGVFLFFVIVLLLTAFGGVIIGSLGLKKTGRKLSIIGLAIGELVLLLVILYSFLPALL